MHVQDGAQNILRGGHGAGYAATDQQRRNAGEQTRRNRPARDEWWHGSSHLRFEGPPRYYSSVRCAGMFPTHRNGGALWPRRR